jgi:hypothetical protein
LAGEATPSATQDVAKDPAAEALAYALARQNAEPDAVIQLGQRSEGNAAAAFDYDIRPLNGSGYGLYVYLVKQPAGWQLYEKFVTQNFSPPFTGFSGTLQFKSGCVNVRESPSLTAKVVTCLGSGASIQIDGTPTFADGYIWWHLGSRGWAVHKFLYCLQGQFSSFPQC